MNKHWRIEKVGNALTKLRNAAKADPINYKQPSGADFQSTNMRMLLHNRTAAPTTLDMPHRVNSTGVELSQSISAPAAGTRGSVSASVAVAHINSRCHSDYTGFDAGRMGMTMRERERAQFANFSAHSKRNEMAREISESIQSDLMPIDNDTKHLLALMNYKPNFEADSGKDMRKSRSRQSMKPGFGYFYEDPTKSRNGNGSGSQSSAVRLIPTDRMATIGQANWHQSVRNPDLKNVGAWRPKQTANLNKKDGERNEHNRKTEERQSEEGRCDGQLNADAQDYRKYLRFDPKATWKPKRFDEIYLEKDEKPMGTTSAAQQLLALNRKPSGSTSIVGDGSQKTTKVKKRFTYHDTVLEKKNKETMSILAKQKEAQQKAVKMASEQQNVIRGIKKFVSSEDSSSANLVKKSESKGKSQAFKVPLMRPTLKPQLSAQRKRSTEQLTNTSFKSKYSRIEAPKSNQKYVNEALKDIQASPMASSLTNIKSNSTRSKYFSAI